MGRFEVAEGVRSPAFAKGGALAHGGELLVGRNGGGVGAQVREHLVDIWVPGGGPEVREVEDSESGGEDDGNLPLAFVLGGQQTGKGGVWDRQSPRPPCLWCSSHCWSLKRLEWKQKINFC